jgi:hypothetical protein
LVFIAWAGTKKNPWNLNKFIIKMGFYVPQASMISLACFKAVKYESILAVQPVQVSLAIRGGYVPEKFGFANTKTAILGLYL